MMRLILLVLVLSACASQQPATYNQGAFRPPPPPAFNPTTDAPITIGQPGHRDPAALPRSHHGRVLPQTPDTRREPGIWAATDAPPTGPLEVLGVKIPLTGDDAKADPRSAHLRRCAGELTMLTASMPGFAAEDLDASLGPASRRCLAARAMVACMDHRYKMALDARVRLPASQFKAAAGPVNILASATNEARRLEHNLCHPHDMHQMTFGTTLDVLTSTWRETHGSEPWMTP
jgi:hypothetical protein